MFNFTNNILINILLSIFSLGGLLYLYNIYTKYRNNKLEILNKVSNLIHNKNINEITSKQSEVIIKIKENIINSEESKKKIQTIAEKANIEIDKIISSDSSLEESQNNIQNNWNKM